jgi:hypothetical protein
MIAIRPFPSQMRNSIVKHGRQTHMRKGALQPDSGISAVSYSICRRINVITTNLLNVSNNRLKGSTTREGILVTEILGKCLQ